MMIKKEFEERFEVEFLDELRFDDDDFVADIRKRCAKKLKKKALKAENNWRLALFEEEFRKKIVPKLEVKWINHRIGYGVFAKEAIPSLTYVGEYSGVVKKRKWRDAPFNNYVFAYTIARKKTGYIIDAEKAGGLVRFINHSDYPNVQSHWLIVDRICHIIMHTIQPIPAGGQLDLRLWPDVLERANDAMRSLVPLYNDLVFESEALKSEVKDYSQKLLLQPAMRLESQWKLSQFGENFAARHFPKLSICYINDFFGAGVFAKEGIEPRTLVAAYFGLVRKRQGALDQQNNYIFDYPCDAVIDSKNHMSFGSYMNHNANPNCTSDWLIFDGVFYVIFTSLQVIQSDQQLTYDYGPHFWTKKSP